MRYEVKILEKIDYIYLLYKRDKKIRILRVIILLAFTVKRIPLDKIEQMRGKR